MYFALAQRIGFNDPTRQLISEYACFRRNNTYCSISVCDILYHCHTKRPRAISWNRPCVCRSSGQISRERANRQTEPVWVCPRCLDTSVLVDQQSETRLRGHSPNSDSFPVMRSFQHRSIERSTKRGLCLEISVLRLNISRPRTTPTHVYP